MILANPLGDVGQCAACPLGGVARSYVQDTKRPAIGGSFGSV